LKFITLAVSVVVVFTKSEMTFARLKERPNISRMGINAMADPTPPNAKKVESNRVIIKKTM
jgi:dephospho-CoA kinase